MLTLTACGILDNDDCTMVGAFAVSVAVTDAATGASPAVPVTVRLEQGDYATESSTPWFAERPRYLLGDDGGVYRVLVRAKGYAEARRENVRVTETRCGQPRTVELSIALDRAP